MNAPEFAYDPASAVADSVPRVTRDRVRAAPWRRLATTGGCVVIAGIVLVVGLQSGGYFAQEYLAAGAIAFAACALMLAAGVAQAVPTRGSLALLAGLLGLAALSTLSSAWSADGTGATEAAQRAAAYAAVTALVVVSVAGTRRGTLMLQLLVSVLVALCGVALVSRLRPDLIGTDAALLRSAHGRLAYPITYWNGLGAIAAMAGVACICMASDARDHLARRALWASGGVVALTTLYLTLSRGSWIALVAGLVVVFVTSRRRVRIGASALVVGAASGVAVLVVHHHPVLVDAPGTLAAQKAAGDAVVVPLLVCLLAAAGLTAGTRWVPGLARHGRTGRVRRSRRASSTRAAAITVVAVLLLGSAYALAGSRLDGSAALGGSRFGGFVSRQYDTFMRPGTAPTGQQRLLSAESSRSDAWRIGLDEFASHPLAGSGAGSYHVAYMRHRRTDEKGANAHSLEIETAAELGLAGVAVLGLLLVAMGWSLRGMRRPRGGLTRTQSAAAGGAVTAWLVHSAFDWDWQLAAVTLPALAFSAVLLASADRPTRHGAPA